MDLISYSSILEIDTYSDSFFFLSSPLLLYICVRMNEFGFISQKKEEKSSLMTYFILLIALTSLGSYFQDSRLRSGDHILQIGDVNLRGMGSDQVAAVLRQSGSHVRLIVARPVEPTSPDFQVSPA